MLSNLSNYNGNVAVNAEQDNKRYCLLLLYQIHVCCELNTACYTCRSGFLSYAGTAFISA